MNVAKMIIGAGRMPLIASPSTSWSCVSHPCPSTALCWSSGTAEYAPPNVSSPVLSPSRKSWSAERQRRREHEHDGQRARARPTARRRAASRRHAEWRRPPAASTTRNGAPSESVAANAATASSGERQIGDERAREPDDRHRHERGHRRLQPVEQVLVDADLDVDRRQRRP